MKKIMNLFLILSLCGCGTMGKDLKQFLAGKTPLQTKSATNANPSDDGLIRFSGNNNLQPLENRSYERITRDDFERRELNANNAGSLWIMEGQDSYLFSDNMMRLPGDILNVNLDGQPEKQLATKANVIRDLQKRVASRNRQLAAATSVAQAAVAAPGAITQQQGGTQENQNPNQNQQNQQNQGQNAENQQEDNKQEGEVPFDVKSIPTRIVERMSDGNYRVRGTQNFMIGPTEYRVIVTGFVRPSDVSQNSVESSKLLDSKFDIVKQNRGKEL